MRRAEPVAGFGGILLLVSLFLPWYGRMLSPDAPDGPVKRLAIGEPSVTAWEAFTVFDVLIALCALPAIAVPIVSLVTSGPAKSIGTAVLGSFFGGLAVLLVAYRVINEPGPDEFVALKYGAGLALAGALGAFVGSWLSMRDESTPGAVPPDVPVRPAPPVSAS
jgi:uncharacterized membrane protein YfcA